MTVRDRARLNIRPAINGVTGTPREEAPDLTHERVHVLAKVLEG
jgi:hypothetical protein